MTDNLKLWDLLEKTDPAHVKPITGKAYQGNSPRPHYLVRKATEVFGPCGIGWGFSIVKEELLEGAPVGNPVFREQIHSATVKVWYQWEGKTGEVEHVGQTIFCGVRRNGSVFTDEDAPKKSVTDALTKALSMIGMAGDIFLGNWDDSKYVEGLKAEADERRNVAGPQDAKPDTSLSGLDLGVGGPTVTPLTGGWLALKETAEAYPDTHTWDECFAWWRDNIAILEKIKERDNLVYGEIYKKFMAKKPK